MQCPQCGSETYTSGADLEICPKCGHGAPAGNAARAEQDIARENYQRSPGESHPDRIYRAGVWELRVIYKARGSKSEGSHGTLHKDGEAVTPGEVGEVLQTDLGLMKYYGSLEGVIPLWQMTGWHFADQDLILPSWEQDDNSSLHE